MKALRSIFSRAVVTVLALSLAVPAQAQRIGTGVSVNQVLARQRPGAGQPWSLPAWAFNNPYVPGVSLVQNGSTFSTTFNPANYKDTGTTFCVDNVAGSDSSGTGAAGACFASASKAVQTVANGSIVSFVGGTVTAPRRYVPPLGTELTGRSGSLTFTTATLGTVVFGNLVTQAEVTTSPFASGKNTVTLASGTPITGFVDFANNDPLAEGMWRVAQDAGLSGTSANVTTKQTAGLAAIARIAPAVLGAVDQRDLTGLFDTSIAAWRADAPTRYFDAPTGGKLFLENLVFIGENVVNQNSAGSTLVLFNDRYIGGYNALDVNSTAKVFIAVNFAMSSGSDLNGATDVADVNTPGQVLDNFRVYNASNSPANQAYTSHSGSGLIVNPNLLSGSAGATGKLARQVFAGGAVGGSVYGVRVGGFAPYSHDSHFKGVAFPGTPSISSVYSGGIGVGFRAAAFVYDTSPDGKAVVGGPIIDRRGNKPAGQQTDLLIDSCNRATVLKSDGTPVVSDGDAVAKVIDANGSGSYFDLVSAAGTGSAVWKTDGSLCWIQQVQTKWMLNAVAPLHEDETITVAMQLTTGENTWIMIAVPSFTGITAFVDYRGTSAVPFNNNVPFPISSVEGMQVNNGATLPSTTAAPLMSALGTGSNKVWTLRRFDLGWTPWMSMSLFSSSSTPTAANSMDSRIYSVRYSWNGSNAEIAATNVADGLKAGLVLP